MSTSKNRPRWNQLPPSIRAQVEQLIGGPVVRARNCPGGFSPGFASLLTRADGRLVFVKAMDADTWPGEAELHRTEARVGAALPSTIPAPRFLGTVDDGRWTALAFEGVDGAEPEQPWNTTDLDRVVAAVLHQVNAGTSSPVAVPRDHPRLGGWVEVARDRTRLTRLAEHSTWAADELPRLVRLERDGLAAAQGDSLVHFDLYPHNVLLTPDRVVFVDWPHARRGAPLIDLVTVLSSAAADRIDPDPILDDHTATTPVEPGTVDAILAAHTGFLLSGGLSAAQPGLEAIATTKLHLGLGALTWLERRLTNRT